ncbi:hypothetical protein PFICI_13378 [Pestalotiopsis fici W106-1]|uniref:Heterokaryon incompatibility domain-containing protein n=1 Tax=Pestalotiopsis fici (strain W106-1 / CGMCC3.15140) TaxID=1229662 RepID=W3WMA6_PESFW|nr:uncharacterized protein PFICI_13378 [Pestalotiopsis fici W106-1]ETS74894.1 hypothetical protein PFICI_13378 [Pestalotiopsis fici W106-1]
MYAIAKEQPHSYVRISINSDNIFAGDTLEQVSIFNTLLVQVGPDGILHDDREDDEDFLSYPPQLVLAIQNHGQNIQIERFQIGCYPTDPDLRSSANFSIARNWLHHCRHEHTECRFDYTPVLPTRVIDVGFDEKFRDTRLLLSEGLKAEYVALSHCWGGPISPVLTDKLVGLFQEYLPFKELSANFKDAIVVTRQLGMRYLWIDSLCIIQNSKADWEKESKRMDSVYGNATVTLSAMASAGSTEGILKSIPVEISPLPVPLRVFADNHNLNVMIKRYEPTAEDLNKLDMKGPLSSRGWTLQEFVLSPRHLLYGAHQIYWKCAVGYFSADGLTNGLRFPEHGYDGVAAILHSRFRDSHVQKCSPSLNGILNEYYKMVSTYSHRTLTFKSDKLPAFSGLAQGLHELLGGHYLAGLWSCDIGDGLLWHGELGSAVHVSRYRAPSWSWAVTDEPVVFDVDAHEIERDNPFSVQMISHEMVPRVGANPYGEIRSGSLTLKGFTRPIIRSKQVIPYLGYEEECGCVDFDDAEVTDNVRVFDRGIGRQWVAIRRTYGERTDWEVDPGLYYAEEYMLLYIHHTRRDYCLVLKPSHLLQSNAYERVGLFVTFEDIRESVAGWKTQTIVLV